MMHWSISGQRSASRMEWAISGRPARGRMFFPGKPFDPPRAGMTASNGRKLKPVSKTFAHQSWNADGLELRPQDWLAGDQPAHATTESFGGRACLEEYAIFVQM